jgi:hypothetical protein
MISTVVKHTVLDNIFYVVTLTDGEIMQVPHDTANRHYQEILEWVALGNTITDNGGGE